MPITSEQVNRVLNLVAEISENCDEQLSILAHAFSQGCILARVPKETALKEMLRIIEADYDQANN